MSVDVLVTGSRGKTGREVVLQLLAVPGSAVRAGSSGPLADPTHDRMRHVRFDWNDPGTWQEAVSGADAVYLMRPDVPEAPQLVADLVGLASSAHIVLLSEQGAGEMASGSWENRVESAVVKHAGRWTLLRPSWFQQVLTDTRFYLESIRDDRVISLPSGGAGIAWIDARDIASVAVAALLEPGVNAGQVHTITGPDAVTVDAVANALSGALGLPVRSDDPPTADALEGLDPWPSGLAEQLYGRVQAGIFGEVSPSVERLTGRQPRSIQDFITEHADRWRT